MFWKKKKSDNVTIQLDDDDRRASVRIQPMDKVFILYENQQLEVMDISTTGLSFKSDRLKGCEHLNITLHLPPLAQRTDHEELPINCTIQVLRSSKAIFHCQFMPLEPEAQDQLDQFILNEQKRQIRTKSS